MDSDEEDIQLEATLVSALAVNQQRKERKMWVRPIFSKRKEQGEYHNLLQEMRLSDADSHFRYLRMSKERFDNLLAEVIAIARLRI